MSGLSQSRAFFGIHSVSPYSRSTGMPYGIMKVLGGSALKLDAELIDLMGGSSKYAYHSEDGAISSEMTLKFKEYPNFVFELFLGLAPTDNAAETGGAISSALANVYGTSVSKATTGIATLAIKTASKADLKFGNYVIKAISATTVHVYYMSDVDIGRGTNGSYQDDTLKITATALTIATATDVDIPNFGLTLTGGSGAIAMVVGDTAKFSVRPVNTGSTSVVIGSADDTIFPEFGCLVYGQKRGNQELVELDAFRCKAAGMPISFDEKAWSEAEVKVKLLFDQALNGIFELTTCKFL